MQCSSFMETLPPLSPSPLSDTAAPPTSLPSTFTADPAATLLSPTLTPSPAATLTSSPVRGTPSGRSKAQRWDRDTPPTRKSGRATPLSFKEALLQGVAVHASPPAPRASSPLSPPRGSGPRIVVRSAPRRSSAMEPDADGWVTAVSRKTRRTATPSTCSGRPPREVLQLLLSPTSRGVMSLWRSVIQVSAFWPSVL